MHCPKPFHRKFSSSLPKVGALSLLLALALPVIAAAPAAQAATLLGTIERDYGSAPGKIDPGGTDPLEADRVRVLDQAVPGGARFYDNIFFTSIDFDVLDRLVFTVTFRDANGSASFDSENWFMGSIGTTPGTSADNHRIMELGNASPQTAQIDAGIDVGETNVWARAVTERVVVIGFGENTNGNDEFFLDRIDMEVWGTAPATAPVPLPASVLFLLGGVGGLAGLRRLKALRG